MDDSLLRLYAGDWRSMLPGISAGILQLSHPAISAGVQDHSRFAEEHDARLVRSIPQIWGTMLGAQSEVSARARDIRDAHRGILGEDHRGREYHALAPETFWWAHATFTWEIFRSVELFHRRALTDLEIDRLYQETVDWYALYGMTMRPVPSDYGEFVRRFDGVCGSELELTPAARRLGVGRPIGGNALDRARGRLGVGCLPAELRERWDLPWSKADQRWFDSFRAVARTGFQVLPHDLNRATLVHALRFVGARTRYDRIRQDAA